ncbi:MAG: AAA family ATPase [Acidimicrobiales bacterium]
MGVQRRTRAVVGFIDLSGFTATSELLAAEGREGTEQLRDFINDLFSPAIALIERSGGEIAWFAGDAMVAFFDIGLVGEDQGYGGGPPGDESARVGDAVEALADVAALISDRPPTETLAGRVSMSAKVGVALGELWANDSGGARPRHWMDGDAIDLSADAEALAEPGEVVLHESVIAAVPDLTVEPGTGRYHRHVRRVRKPQSEVRRIPERWAWLRGRDRLPAAVAEALLDDGAEQDTVFLEQHRPATSLFMGLPFERFDERTVRLIDSIVGSLGGELLMLSSGDKGTVAFAAFGAPVAGPDRELRAVSAALQLLRAVPLARIGLASGMVYAGRIGSSDRWDYTVLGDRVNVAARLMQVADESQIIADAETTRPLAARVVVSDLRQVQTKGKSEPESVSTVLSLRSVADELLVPPGASTLFGRDAEVQAIADRLSEPGRVVGVLGEAGSGKTRLVDAVSRSVDLDTVVTVAGHSESPEPYGIFQRGLGPLLGLTAVEAEQLFGDDERWPLLAPLLGFREVEPTLLAETLSGSDRQRATVQIVVDALRATGHHPAVWLIEDLHFADDASRELLIDLIPHVATLPIAVLATSRPQAGGLETWAGLGAEVRELNRLNDDATLELISSRWADHFGLEPTSELSRELAERCGGSPMYAEELVAWAATSGLAATVTSLPDDLDVPSSIVDLVLTRLDRLPPKARPIVSFASVLGRTFDRRELIDAFAGERSPDVWEEGLSSVVDAGLLVESAAVSFTHGLMQEVAYERMSYGLRRRLHRSVLGYLEEANPDRGPIAQRLAHHAERSDDVDRQRQYFRLAGGLARQDWAISNAIHWYELLAPLAEPSERAELHLELGRMSFTSGDWDSSEEHLTQAGKLGSFEVAARSDMSMAELLVAQGSADRGFDMLDERLDALGPDGDPDLAIDILESQVELASLLGDVDRAELVRSRHRGLAEAHHPAGDQPLPGLAVLAWMSGELDEARRLYQEILVTAEREGDLSRVAQARSDLAGLAYSMDDTDECLAQLAAARDLAEKIGLKQQLAVLTGNEAQMRFDLGDLEASAALAWRTINQSLDLGDNRLVSHGLVRLGLAEGDIELVQRAIVLADAIGNDWAKNEGLLGLARLAAERGDGETATAMLRDMQPSPEDQLEIDRIADLIEHERERAEPSPRTPAVSDEDRSKLVDRLDLLPALVDWRAALPVVLTQR